MQRRITQLVLLALLSLLVGCADPQGQTGEATGEAVAQVVDATVTPIPTAPSAAPPTYTVQRGRVEELLTFSGRWLPRDQLQLSFEIAGTIRQVNVRNGDAVTAGQLLVDYQIDDLEDQLASAELDLQFALLELQSGAEGSTQSVTDAQFQLANSRLSLESTRDSIPWTNLESARIGLESAQLNLENAQRAYDAAISDPSNPASVVDGAYEGLQNAQIQLRTAQNTYYSSAQSYNDYLYQIAQAENNVLQNEIALQEAQSGVGVNTQSLQAVYNAQLNIEQIQEQIAQSSLYAPIDGVILEITVRPGDQADAFTTVITMALPEPLEAIANLAFADTQRLSIGMIGECQIVNRDESRVQCVVRQIPLSSRDADQTVRVAASLEGVELGQLIEIDMPLQIREDVLWLPPEAIRTFQGRTFVIVQTPDGEQVVDVQLGLQTDDRVEILEVEGSVVEGDIVVGQ